MRFSVLASSRKISLSCAVKFKASFVRMKGLSAVMNQLQKLLSPGEKTSFLYAIVDCSDPSLKQPPRVFEAQGTQGSRRGSGLSGSSTRDSVVHNLKTLLLASQAAGGLHSTVSVKRRYMKGGSNSPTFSVVSCSLYLHNFVKPSAKTFIV